MYCQPGITSPQAPRMVQSVITNTQIYQQQTQLTYQSPLAAPPSLSSNGQMMQSFATNYVPYCPVMPASKVPPSHFPAPTAQPPFQQGQTLAYPHYPQGTVAPSPPNLPSIYTPTTMSLPIPSSSQATGAPLPPNPPSFYPQSNIYTTLPLCNPSSPQTFPLSSPKLPTFHPPNDSPTVISPSTPTTPQKTFPLSPNPPILYSQSNNSPASSHVPPNWMQMSAPMSAPMSTSISASMSASMSAPMSPSRFATSNQGPAPLPESPIPSSDKQINCPLADRRETLEHSKTEATIPCNDNIKTDMAHPDPPIASNTEATTMSEATEAMFQGKVSLSQTTPKKRKPDSYDLKTIPKSPMESMAQAKCSRQDRAPKEAKEFAKIESKVIYNSELKKVPKLEENVARDTVVNRSYDVESEAMKSSRNVSQKSANELQPASNELKKPLTMIKSCSAAQPRALVTRPHSSQGK